MTHAVKGVAAPCRWCRRPIVRIAGRGWVHTDGRAYCLDVWRWAELPTIATPGGTN